MLQSPDTPDRTISKDNNDKESDLIEFPSIYHELNMKDFLISIGFLEEDAKNFYYINPEFDKGILS